MTHRTAHVHWVEMRPRDPATAGIATLRFAGGAVQRSYYREENGQHYKAGLVSAPRFSVRVGFGRDGFTGQTIPQSSRIQIAPAEPAVFESLASYFWKDAEISIDAGPENAAVFGRLFTGTIVSDAIADGILTLTIADLSTRLDKPVCDTRFAGNGGIEGGEEAEGRTKRRSWGHVFNVEGRLLDAANSIYEFGDPAYPLTSFSALRDKGRTGPFSVLAWQGSIAATLTALQASAPAQGGGVVAPSIACAKWWTEPSGPLTADLVGTPGTGSSMAAASLIDAVSARFAGPAVIDRAAANALRPADAGLHVGDETTTGAQVIDRLALGSSLIWVAAPEGVIRLLPWTFDDGGADVLQGQFIGRERAHAPHYRRRVGFRANNRRHSESEIAESVLGSTIVYDDGSTVPADKVFYSGPEPVSVDDLRPAERGATNGAPGLSPVGDRTAQDVVDDLDINAAAIIAQALRQDDMGLIFDARTLIEGQPVSTQFFEFRQQQETDNSAFVSNFSLLGAKTPDGTAWNLAADLVQVDGESLAQKFTEIGTTTGVITATVEFLQETLIDDSGGFARATLLATVLTGGVKAIAGISATSDGENAPLVFLGTSFTFVDNSGENPIIPLSYADGRWKMTDVFIEKLEVGAVVTDSIDPFAIRKRYIARLASNTGLPTSGGASITVLSINATKDEADSDIEVSFFARVRPGDDYAGYFQIEYTIGGGTTVHDTIWYWKPSVVLGGFRSARGTEGHRDYISGLPAGSITFTLRFFYHAGSASGGFMEQGTNFAVEEIKR